MKVTHLKLAMLIGGAVLMAPAPASAAGPVKGGILKFVVPDEPPSFDGHTRDDVRPDPSDRAVLQRADPGKPGRSGNATDFVCDLCTEMPKPADGGKTYTFKIRQGVKFHDGSPLIGQGRARHLPAHHLPARRAYRAHAQAQFGMVESVTAPDAETVVFKLKYPSGAFIPALATPFNFIYSKANLDKDQHWYEKNVMGSGPFVFEEREAGASSSRASATRTTPRRASPTSTASRRSSPRRRRCACRRSAAIRRRSSSAASRPRAATIWSRRSARTSRSRRATGTACCSSRPITRRSRSTTCACARRSDLGGRPLGRLEGPFQDRHRQGGGRHRLPGPSAGGDEGGAASRSRLLARHQQVARGGQEAVEGGRRTRTSSSRCPIAPSTSPTPSSAPG